MEQSQHKTSSVHLQHWCSAIRNASPKTLLVLLNRLRIGGRRFRSSLRNWGMARTAACECGAENQADITTDSLFYFTPHSTDQLIRSDEDTASWLQEASRMLDERLKRPNERELISVYNASVCDISCLMPGYFFLIFNIYFINRLMAAKINEILFISYRSLSHVIAIIKHSSGYASNAKLLLNLFCFIRCVKWRYSFFTHF